MPESIPTAGEIQRYLKSLGITKYEALVYIALLKTGSAPASRLHEVSGVPRASVYPVLDRLLEKNMATVSNTQPKLFRPNPPDEAVDDLLQQVQKDADLARSLLNDIYHEEPEHEPMKEQIWSIYGDEQIKKKIIDTLSMAQESVRCFTTWTTIAENLLPIFDEISQRGVDVVLVTNEWDEKVPQNVKVLEVRSKIKSEFDMSSDLAGIFIIDNRIVLCIIGTPDGEPTALYSESRGFLNFYQQYFAFLSTHLTGAMPEKL